MSEVKRYSVLIQHPQCGQDTEHWGVMELPNGEYVKATDYDAETARADQAEAGCAALGKVLNLHPDTPFPEALEVVKQLFGTQHDVQHWKIKYNELAQIVEGLPVATTKILIDDLNNKGCYQIADALAALLAWRQEGEK